jgi:hypothetical protein
MQCARQTQTGLANTIKKEEGGGGRYGTESIARPPRRASERPAQEARKTARTTPWLPGRLSGRASEREVSWTTNLTDTAPGTGGGSGSGLSMGEAQETGTADDQSGAARTQLRQTRETDGDEHLMGKRARRASAKTATTTARQGTIHGRKGGQRRQRGALLPQRRPRDPEDRV